jgi:hypothetical protein
VVRAVLDANVVASALIRPAGPPGRIVSRLLRERAFELVVSPPIVEEWGRCLRYPRVRERAGLSDSEIELWVAGLALVADVVPAIGSAIRVPADPADEMYLAAALEGRAGFVVSGDSHLLTLAGLSGVRVVTARSFLELIEG